MKQKLPTILFLIVLVFNCAAISANAAAIDTAPEIRIGKDGKVMVDNAKVTGVISTTLFTQLKWGWASIQVRAKTDSSTKFTKYFGEQITLADVAQGDYLKIEGNLETGSDMLSVIAKKIINLSIKTETAKFFGTVSGISTTTSELFYLSTTNEGVIAVKTSSATNFKKGSLNINTGLLQVGDKVTNASGVYDHPTKVLQASKVIVYVDMAKFKPKNYQGILKTAPGAALPTSLVLTINGKDYTVNLAANASVLNNKKKKAILGRFVVGDIVRVYGAIQESDQTVINATVVRNTDL